MNTQYLITVSHTAGRSHRYYKCLRRATNWTSIVKTYNYEVAKRYESREEAEAVREALTYKFPALYLAVVEKPVNS